jgi:hypothetical protein
MPSVPLAHSHRKGVEIFVKLIQEGNGLDDHIVSTTRIKFHFGTRVRVTETQLGLLQATVSQHFHKFGEMSSNGTKDFADGFIRATLNS